MQYTINLTSKGQMTLPKKARDTLGVKPKDQVVVEVQRGRVTVKKALSLQDIWRLTATDKRWPGDRKVDELLAKAKMAEYGKPQTNRTRH